MHPSVDRRLEVGDLEQVGWGRDQGADRAISAVLRQGNHRLEGNSPADALISGAVSGNDEDHPESIRCRMEKVRSHS